MLVDFHVVRRRTFVLDQVWPRPRPDNLVTNFDDFVQANGILDGCKVVWLELSILLLHGGVARTC